jgi:hypothetical protein
MNEILHKILCKFFNEGIYAYSQYPSYFKDFMIQFDDEYYLVTRTDIKEVNYNYFNKFATNLKLSMYFCDYNDQGIIDILDYRFKIKSMFPEFVL